jgi:hypothetical protein
LLLKFPELPPTLYAMQSGTDSPTQLCIELPDNYTPERKFPLFVFLYGGHGGPGSGAGRGQEIMERRDCIFVNLPLFKTRLDSEGPAKGMMITTEADGELISRAYTAMLRRIYDTIPNIDTDRNIVGGMSNGAHSIVAMFEQGDPSLTGLFQNLILIEGGFHAAKDLSRYRGKSVLFLYGDYAGQDDWLGRRMREQLPRFVARFTEQAAAEALDVTGIEMKDTGHDMPRRFDADVKLWVDARLAENRRRATPGGSGCAPMAFPSPWRTTHAVSEAGGRSARCTPRPNTAATATPQGWSPTRAGSPSRAAHPAARCSPTSRTRSRTASTSGSGTGGSEPARHCSGDSPERVASEEHRHGSRTHLGSGSDAVVSRMNRRPSKAFAGVTCIGPYSGE